MRHHGNGSAEVDKCELVLDGLDNTENHLMKLTDIFIIDSNFFRFTDLLSHDVLGQCRSCTGHACDFNLTADLVTENRIRLDFARVFERDLKFIILDIFNNNIILIKIDGFGFGIDFRNDIDVCQFGILLVCLCHCFLQSFNDHIGGNVAFLFHCIERLDHILVFEFHDILPIS